MGDKEAMNFCCLSSAFNICRVYSWTERHKDGGMERQESREGWCRRKTNCEGDRVKDEEETKSEQTLEEPDSQPRCKVDLNPANC